MRPVLMNLTNELIVINNIDALVVNHAFPRIHIQNGLQSPCSHSSVRLLDCFSHRLNGDYQRKAEQERGDEFWAGTLCGAGDKTMVLSLIHQKQSKWK